MAIKSVAPYSLSSFTTISGDIATFLKGSSYQQATSSLAKKTIDKGKYYAEITLTQIPSNVYVGISKTISSWNADNRYNNTAITIYSYNGNIFF